MTTTPNTTASGAANAGLHALADRIEEAQGRAICISVESADYLREALAASAPVAPAPQPAPMPYPTDAQVDAVYEQTMSQPLRSQDAPAVRRFGRAMFLCAWNAADPKAAPAQTPLTDAAQQVVREALDAVDVHPCDVNNDSIRAKGLHGSMAALHAALAAAPQQGEYLPLPECDATTVGLGEVWNRHSMRAYVDADRAARGAAQAAPVPVPSGLRVERGFRWDDKALHHIPNLLVEFEPVPALSPNDMKGWKDRDAVADMLTAPRPAPVAEDAEIRKALDDAATALETISRIAGRDKDMLGMMDVRLYAAARAKAAREAQAAQPEGGAK